MLLVTGAEWFFFARMASKVSRDRSMSLVKVKEDVRHYVSAKLPEMFFNAEQAVFHHLTVLFISDGRHIDKL